MASKSCDILISIKWQAQQPMSGESDRRTAVLDEAKEIGLRAQIKMELKKVHVLFTLMARSVAILHMLKKAGQCLVDISVPCFISNFSYLTAREARGMIVFKAFE